MILKFPSTALAFVLACSSAGAAVSINFNGGTEFADNFRSTYANGAPTSQGGGVVTTAATTANPDNGIFLYDTTPADNGVQTVFNTSATVTMDIRAATAGSSFGFFIVNPASEGSATHILALFNWDVTGANDRLRIWNSNTIIGTGVGTNKYDSGATATVDSGAGAGGGFTTATLTYSQGANNSAIINFTVGTMSTGSVNLGNNTYIADYELGFRLFDAGRDDAPGTSMDNFTVSVDPIPEPSAVMIGALGLAAAGFRRRR